MMEARKMATSEESHERTGREGVRGAFKEEKEDALEGVDGGCWE